MSGVRRVGASSVAPPGAARLDTGLDTGVDGFHAGVAVALGFPAYYGRNLDALADCLRDVDPGTTLVWDGWAGYATEHPRSFRVALTLLGDAVTVLLRGDGPQAVIAGD